MKNLVLLLLLVTAAITLANSNGTVDVGEEMDTEGLFSLFS